MKVDNRAAAARKTGRPHLISEGNVGMEGSVYQTVRRLGRFFATGNGPEANLPLDDKPVFCQDVILVSVIFP